MSRDPSSTPTIAVIGCGAIADSFHVPALSRHEDVRARMILVDPAEERARALCQAHGITRTAADLDAVIGEIDGAVIAVPPRFHHPVARQCLEAQVAVLCEKPLCEEPAKARELVEVAERTGTALAVNQTRRLFPAFRRVRELVAEGTLGSLQHIEYVLGEPFEWPAATDSYFGPKGGGKGVLLDTGAHIVDLVCWWLGGQPRLVDYRDDAAGGTEAVADLVLEQDGCRAHVRLSWLSKLENAYRVEGERGSVSGGVYEWGSYTHAAGGGAGRRVRTEEKVSTFKDIANKLADNFLAVVRGTAEPLVPGREVLPSIEIIDACYARRARFDLPWHDACERLSDVA